MDRVSTLQAWSMYCNTSANDSFDGDGWAGAGAAAASKKMATEPRVTSWRGSSMFIGEQGSQRTRTSASGFFHRMTQERARSRYHGRPSHAQESADLLKSLLRLSIVALIAASVA